MLHNLLSRLKGRKLGRGRLVLGLVVVLLASVGVAFARQPEVLARQVSPVHPVFPLLDENGENVLETQGAVSTMQTCGACHDTDFIASHSDHAALGLEQVTGPGQTPGSRAWDMGTGFFGKWNPLTYRYLSSEDNQVQDLTTPDWIRAYADHVVGGGPAVYSRSGELLTTLAPSPDNNETATRDPQTGQRRAWDWQESGVVEMNCFVCHTTAPNQEARVGEIQAGNFRWASTATLLGSGIVTGSSGSYSYSPEAFDERGDLRQEFAGIQDPSSANCGVCHAQVHTDPNEPLVSTADGLDDWRALTTGQIISPERLSNSGLNLQGKESLTRPADIHAERGVTCTDCHYSLNNPVYFQEDPSTRPDHLTFDPRRLEIGEYLEKPVHQFARGASSQSAPEGALSKSMRSCDGCHNSQTTHTWLPYQERHMDVLSCETCHVPTIYGAAFRQVDWTVLQADGTPRTAYRGVEGQPGELDALVTGYQPVLAQRTTSGGAQQIAPSNLIGAWYWVYGDPPQPVRLEDLKSAWLEGETYAADLLPTFDRDGSGALDAPELALDSDEKVSLISNRLAALGLENPRIQGEVQAYNLNHTVAAEGFATRECQACHGSESRLAQSMLIADYLPGGVMPAFTDASSLEAAGKLIKTETGRLLYQPEVDSQDVYVIGHSRVGWIDLGGALAFVGVLLAVGAHSTFRFLAALRLPKSTARVERVYMYGVYERFWHWLQTATILGLLFTGLIIHNPETIGIFSFRFVVEVHNILAIILLANAGLSLFYHLASGEIKQYIPRPAGFFDQAVVQGLFYLRGIFKGEPHPFEKTPDKKLNPLQQVTYFGILNVLLPLQVITGILMWGVSRWPELTARLGGLPFLAPFHTLVAWLFAAFIVAHVYLTTTGHTALGGIQAMMIGWDEVETHTPAEEGSEL